MLSRILWALLLSLVLVVSASPSLYAQSTYGSVAGTVTDTSGAIVTGATVTLTNMGTAEKRTQSSGSDGLFTFVNLFPGQYRVDVEKQGFKHFTRANVTVEVQQDTHIVAALQVGEVSQVVEVTGETPLLQSETSSLGQVVEQRKADELPLNGRNIFNLITVSPAAIAQGGSGGTPVSQNPFSWGNYQIGGSFGNQSAEYLDGQPLNIGYINLPIVIPTQDSVGEFKVQYNDLGAEWGKFSGGVMNISTKSGTNQFHGSGYEYLRNKALNSNEYFNKGLEIANGQPNSPPPYVQNQYGFTFGGPVVKDKTFFFVSWEQFRLRTGSVLTTTVPVTANSPFTPAGVTGGMRQGDFSSLCASGFTGPTVDGTPICGDSIVAVNGEPTSPNQIYNPYTLDPAGNRVPFANNQIPSAYWSQATTKMWDTYYIPPNLPQTQFTGANNFTSATSSGGNTNQFVARGDQVINSSTRLFARFTYFGLLDLPTNPFGTGLCNDRCAEDYHTKALAIDINHTFTPTTILDVNLAGSRFIYLRAPILSGFDLTSLGWSSAYNSPAPAIRTPPTPAFPFPNDVGRSQGNSAIGDHNTQYNISPQLTMIRGKHTIQAGGQYELGLDNYYQTNIASGAFGFGGVWTSSTGGATNLVTSTQAAFADFLLGLSENQGTFVNQTEGAAQVPALTAGKQTYRALYLDDTWHVRSKLTLNVGLRYELPGTWSERYSRLSYWDPNATNATVTGCSGAGTVCPGDAELVKTGPNGSGNNLPLDKKAFSPRLGFAYSLDAKTVIRGGYGVFFIPNYVSFGLNPDNDVINLATTPFTATTNSYLTPFSTLNGTGGCSFSGTAPTCADNSGPFGAGGIGLPPGRTQSASLTAAANGSPTLAPWTNPKYGYVEQYNFDIQRQLPAGFFADVAFAGAHGVHLEQYNTDINQIPDSFLSQTTALTTAVTNPLACPSLAACPYAGLNGPTVAAGQLDRPYPEYNNISVAGYGCCSSNYNSLQATVTRRFQGGGTLLAAYTNSKLLSNTDTLTSWLEGGASGTGGVGAVQDWNNLAGERSLSSQDVSQRLVISYVLDLPFGHGKAYLSGMSGVADKVVSGWGVDGITTFQRGFPLKISYSGSTPLEAANLGVANVRPDVVAGCDKKAGGRTVANWFNTDCFATPPDWGFGSESRVDATLRGDGAKNFDFAIFKRTTIAEKVGVEFRTEFFNLFNHPQFGIPGEGFNGTPATAGAPAGNGFGQVTNTYGNPRLIQFAMVVRF
ncbi:MAG: carboxypeptidase-like regulatory domain-containing protein [Candidatus Sulfotelmatobacter sp.]